MISPVPDVKKLTKDPEIDSFISFKVYNELFDILWHSTLPCFQNEKDTTDHMLLSCQLGGKDVNCSNLFTRVPTDTGMCCALNNVDALRDFEYKELVDKQQAKTVTQTMARPWPSKSHVMARKWPEHRQTIAR